MERITKWVTSLLLLGVSAVATALGGIGGGGEAPSEVAEVAAIESTTSIAIATTTTIDVNFQILTREYKYGDGGEYVKELQNILTDVDVDGFYGPLTKEAHSKALTARGLSVDSLPDVPRRTGKRVEYSIPSDKTLRCPQFEAAIKAAGLKPVEVFSYIAYRESRCQPKAIGWNYKDGRSHKDCRLAPAQQYKKCKAVDSYDSGLMQINSSWVTVTSEVCNSPKGDLTVLLDVECNLKVAKWIMDNTKGKLSNWRVYKG